MNRYRNSWDVRVHAAMIASGKSMTSREVLEEFGAPAGRTSASIRLANARAIGWYTTTGTGNGPERLYTAVARPGGEVMQSSDKHHNPNPFQGWGRGFPAVSSVFELWRVL